MDMDGNFPRVAIVLTNFEEHSDVVLVTASINILGDIRADDRESKNGGNVVLG